MNTSLKPLKPRDLLRLFGVPTLLNGFACWVLIPLLHRHFGVIIEAAYFISVGLFVLAPMLCWALLLTRREVGTWEISKLLTRMRIQRLSSLDWLWTGGAFTGLCAASYFVAKVLMPMWGMDATPFFFQNMPLDAEHRWIVAVWPAFFFFNIFGEELLWRGYILPRQEASSRWAWLGHGLCWAFWHVPMGLDLVVAAAPTFFILPAIVQFRKNTTLAIIVHAVFGAFGFLVLAFGGVH